MGGSRYTDVLYSARVADRTFRGIDTFAYNSDIQQGKIKAGVHPSLSPLGVKIRESRDSVTHPKTLPIGILLDTTGSMAEVPKIIQAKLPKLMGLLANEDGSKSYIGDYYPAILMGAVDDCYAMQGEGPLQVGQFESGLEIDDNLTNLWLTQRGGGTYEESYDLGIYFFARHTATDHWEKRNRKGYLFIIGDEKPYPSVSAKVVSRIIGENLQSDIPFGDLMKEVQERYNVYFVIPNMTSHYGDSVLTSTWKRYLPEENIMLLQDPESICELIASTVALNEKSASAEDLNVLAEETRQFVV